jgi:hypothetical protein
MIEGGTIDLKKLDGQEVAPGIFIIGEPTPVAGTNKLRCLANVRGCLALIELSIKFVPVSK